MHDQLNIANTGVSGLWALRYSLNLDISVELEYFEQEPQKVEEKGEKTNSIWIHYRTNNPNLFWGH
jgi:hypothetical protein